MKSVDSKLTAHFLIFMQFYSIHNDPDLFEVQSSFTSFLEFNVNIKIYFNEAG